MSQWENSSRLAIVGNLENRRVRDFALAAMDVGQSLRQLSWLELSDEPDRCLAELETMDWIRIESPGENPNVQDRLFIESGRPRQLEHGELAGITDQHLGFCRLLKRLDSLSSPRFMNPPDDIQTMFDKWRSHQRFADAGLARPDTFLLPKSLPEFRETLRSNSPLPHRIFLKPRYGSSASGVCAFRWNAEREQLIAPIEIDRKQPAPKLFNSLQIRNYTNPEDIDLILERLLPDNMIAEQWIPKARLPHGQFDFRILVVAGDARHVVVRQSVHPMTNLHLGNQRGEMEQVNAVYGHETVALSLALAENAARCFPDSLYAGVDILLSQDGTPVICEINAFGDLLPGVRHRGETTYQAILKACNVYSHSI